MHSSHESHTTPSKSHRKRPPAFGAAGEAALSEVIDLAVPVDLAVTRGDKDVKDRATEYADAAVVSCSSLWEAGPNISEGEVA